MDPASAIIGFVTTGIQVVKLAKEILDDIKDAPKKLQALRDRVADTEILLQGLESRQLDGLFESKEDVEAVERAGRKAKACINKISLFTSKVQKISKDGGLGVKKIKWILEGGTLKDLLEQLGELDDALKAVVNLAILRSQSRQESFQARQAEIFDSAVHGLHLRLSAISLQQSTRLSVGRRPVSAPNPRVYLTPSTKLSCPSDCACRCHSHLSSPVLPRSIAPLVGQLFVPKRILHTIGASSWECNIQTCRRDRKTRHQLTWAARWWYLTISISSNSFMVSLNAPRVIPVYAPVWAIINNGDVDALQALLVAGGASVYDVAEHGEAVFQYAVRTWARNRSEDAVKVIQFLKDAGADPDFTGDMRWSVAEIVSDASLAALIEHPTSNLLHTVRTSTVAVDICRSILDMNVVDVLEDFLPDAYPRAAQMLFGQPCEGEAEDSTVDPEAIIRACGWRSMITYSIWNMPEDATLRLIRSGTRIPEDALPFAVDWGRISLAESLLAAGADVNGREGLGWTALHMACYHLNLDRLELLVNFAGEDIDWHARTPEGENALQIAKRRQLVLLRSPSELETIFDILRAHIPDVGEEEGLEDWEDTSYAIPGAFPASASS